MRSSTPLFLSFFPFFVSSREKRFDHIRFEKTGERMKNIVRIRLWVNCRVYSEYTGVLSWMFHDLVATSALIIGRGKSRILTRLIERRDVYSDPIALGNFSGRQVPPGTPGNVKFHQRSSALNKQLSSRVQVYRARVNLPARAGGTLNTAHARDNNVYMIESVYTIEYSSRE